MEVWIKAHPLLFIAFVLWTIIWKGLALWKSAGLRQKYWFTAILVLNTFGILEIVYLFIVARKYKVEVVEN
ncbi:MAG: DUF5652 family protein [Patescibacteria group bacterium]